MSGMVFRISVLMGTVVLATSCRPSDAPPSANHAASTPARTAMAVDAGRALVKELAAMDVALNPKENLKESTDAHPVPVPSAESAPTGGMGPASPTSAEVTAEVTKSKGGEYGYGTAAVGFQVISLVPVTQCPNQEQHAHLADALATALDPATGIVAQAAARIEVVAPDVWRIMIRQQYAKAITVLALPWGIVLVTLFGFLIMAMWWPKPPANTDEAVMRVIIVQLVPFATGAIGCAWGVVVLSKVAKFIMNPAYYAIQDLLLLLLRQANG